MKKLVLMFVAFAAISFASCNEKKVEAPVEEPAVEVVDSTATPDSTVAAPADSVAAPADSAK